MGTGRFRMVCDLRPRNYRAVVTERNLGSLNDKKMQYSGNIRPRGAEASW